MFQLKIHGMVSADSAQHACRDGCHHCGSRMGRVIGDHIPPNKYVTSADSAIKQITASLGVTNNTHVPPLGRLRYFLWKKLAVCS